MTAHNHPIGAAASPSSPPSFPTGEAGAPNLSTFSWRVEDCPDCDRATDIHCDTCWSSGEVEAACCDCSLVGPLNDEGLCQRCHDAGELPIAEFEARYLGDGWNRVAA